MSLYEQLSAGIDGLFEAAQLREKEKAHSREAWLQRLSLLAAECRQRVLAGDSSIDAVKADVFSLVGELASCLHEYHISQKEYDWATTLFQGGRIYVPDSQPALHIVALACILHALSGEGAHVASIGLESTELWASELSRYCEPFGLTIGLLDAAMDDDSRKKAYAADLTVGLAREFVCDYLRDTLRVDTGAYVQRGHKFIIATIRTQPFYKSDTVKLSDDEDVSVKWHSRGLSALARMIGLKKPLLEISFEAYFSSYQRYGRLGWRMSAWDLLGG